MAHGAWGDLIYAILQEWVSGMECCMITSIHRAGMVTCLGEDLGKGCQRGLHSIHSIDEKGWMFLGS